MKKNKTLYGGIGLILLAIIITFATDTGGIRTFTSKVLGFNNSIDVSSLPKIIDKIDDLVLFDNGNLYRQTEDLFELKLENVGAIASDDMFYYYYINGNELMYVDKTTTDFIGVSLLDKVTSVIKAENGLLGKLSDGSYAFIGDAKNTIFDYIEVPKEVGNVVNYIDTDTDYLINSDGDVYEYMNLTDDIWSWTKIRTGVNDIYLLKDYLYDEQTNTTSSTMAMMVDKNTLVTANEETYNGVISVGKYHILANQSLSYWDKNTPSTYNTGVRYVTYFDDEYLEYYTSSTVLHRTNYYYHILKRYNNENYTVSDDTQEKEYKYGFYEVAYYHFSSAPEKLYKAGYSINTSGRLNHSINTTFPNAANVKGVLTASTKTQNTYNDGKGIRTDYTYYNYYINSSGSLYYLNTDEKTQKLLLNSVEYIDENLNYVIDQNGKYYGFIDNDFIQYKFNENEEVLITSINALNTYDIALDIGDTYQYTVEAYPKNYTEKINWKSSDETMATIDENGLLTAVGKGNPKIYASSANVIDYKLITPKIYPNIESFSLIGKSNLGTANNAYVFADGGSICYFVNPSDTRKYNDFTVETTDYFNIVSTTYMGGYRFCTTVTAKSNQINVPFVIKSNQDPNVKATLKLHTMENKDTLLDLIGIESNYNSQLIMDVEKYNTVNDLFSFKNEEYIPTLMFQSSNENVLKIDEKGTLTAVGEGYAYIYVYYKYLNGTSGEINSYQIYSEYVKVEDKTKKIQAIIDLMPDQTTEKYSEEFIEKAPLHILEGINDSIKNYESSITLKEDNIYTIAIKDKAQNGEEIILSKDITILKADENEAINKLNTKYDIDLYNSIMLYDKTMIQDFILNNIKTLLKNDTYVYEIYNLTETKTDFINKVEFDLEIIDQNNHYYKKVIVNREKTFTVPYEVRQYSDVVQLLESYITTDARFDNLNIQVSHYSYVSGGDINVMGSYQISGDIPTNYYITVLREENPITNIEIYYDKTNTVMVNEKSIVLSPIITPSDAIYETITWTVDDNENATIETIYTSQNVKLTVTKPGTYKITASTNNNEYSKTIDITFTSPNPQKIVKTYRAAQAIYYLYDDGSLYASGDYYDDDQLWVETSKAEFIRGNVKKPIISYYTYNNYYITTEEKLVSAKDQYMVELDNVKDAVVLSNFEDAICLALTHDGNIYEFIYEANTLKKVDIENVKEIRAINDTIFAVTYNNELYVWKTNVFGEKFNNGEFISKPLKLIDNVKHFDYRYGLTNDKNLYYWSDYILNPTIIDTNVNEVLSAEYPYYYEKEDWTYRSYLDVNNKYVSNNASKIAQDIKQIKSNSFYLKKDGTLVYYDYTDVSNVKEIQSIHIGSEEIYTYITNDNKLYQVERTYNEYTREYKYSTYLLANNIDSFIYYDMLRTTDGDLWAWNEAANGAVNIGKNEGINYPAKVLNEHDNDPISVKGIYIYSGTPKHISVGDSLDILERILPYNATNKEVIWSVDNENIASISDDGILTAKAVGKVNVIVTTKDGNYSNSMEINVHPLPNGVTISKDVNKYLYSYEQSENYIGSLQANISPDDSIIHELKWTSSNEDIMTVYANGVRYNDDYDSYANLMIKPNVTGEVTITATTLDGKYSDSITFNIIKQPKQWEASIENTQITVGGTTKINFEIIPEDYPKEYYEFYVDNESDGMVTIDDNLVITGTKEGHVDIQINFIGREGLYENYDNIYHINCMEVVQEGIEINLDIEELYLAASSKDFTDRGTMYANYYTSDNNTANIVWTSSDESILKIIPSTNVNNNYDSSTNIVVGSKTGTVTVTASSPDGKTYDSITYHVVKVNYPTKEIVLDLAKGQTHNIGKYASDIGITYDSWYYYDSLDENIAIVDRYGKVTPVKEGTTYIETATYVLNSILDDDDIYIAKIPVKVINSANIKSVKIDPNGGTYPGDKVFYGNIGSSITISKPTKTFKVTLVENTTKKVDVSATFAGWQLTGSGSINNSTYTFGNDNGVLTAKWTYNKLSLPVPIKKGYTFNGWYTDKALTKAFNSKTLISSNLTLYAKFTQNAPAVTRGDANNDGKITALDYVKVKNHIMKIGTITKTNELYGADMNADGKITALDYVAIKNKIMRG